MQCNLSPKTNKTTRDLHCIINWTFDDETGIITFTNRAAISPIYARYMDRNGDFKNHECYINTNPQNPRPDEIRIYTIIPSGQNPPGNPVTNSQAFIYCTVNRDENPSRFISREKIDQQYQ